MKKLLLGALSFCGMFAHAQTMDSSYNAIGYSAGLSWPQVNKIIQLPNGSTIQALNDHLGVSVSKFNEDGTPDVSFGAYGRRILGVGACVTFPPVDNVLTDMIVDDAEMFVGVGYGTYSYAGCGYDNMDIFRLKRDGTADSTFGLCGMMESGQILGSYPNVLNTSFLTSIRKLPGGQFLVAGHGSGPSVGMSILFMKFNHDGTLDPTFGTNGIYTLPGGFFYNVSVHSPTDISIDSAGNILAVGSGLADVSGYHPYAQVAKILSTGALDYSFGDSGMVKLAYGSSNTISGIKPRSDGKYVLVGSSDGNGTMTIMNPDGTVDSTLITAGYNTLAVPGYATNVIKSFVLQPDNKVLLCGYGMNGYDACAYIGRVNEDGTYDTTFNGYGLDSFNYGVYTHWQSGTFLNDINIVCGNRILAAGGINQTTANSNQGTFIVRMKLDDTSVCNYVIPLETPSAKNASVGIHVYPNPAVETITIENAIVNSGYKLMNMVGQELLSGTLSAASQTIDLTHGRLATGNYILQITYPKGNRFITKVVKN